ncbi:hypothetical protein R3P38DRAFT_2784088 [Favolaschia claudopus]|uniref:Uncharacterized protein n=1 Tax=Favolaschia claudopus TaxID=2862362 RepID=A0AAW0AY46_9AGAR
MSKRRPLRKSLCQDSEEYQSGLLSLATPSGCLMRDAYYYRSVDPACKIQFADVRHLSHPEAREKNRLRMQERRALTRAKRRTRDSAPDFEPPPLPPPSDIPPLSPPVAAHSPSSAPVSEMLMAHDMPASSSHSSATTPTRPARAVNADESVLTALAAVTALNAAPLTEPDFHERLRWRRARYPIYTTWMSWEHYREIEEWSAAVQCA